MSKTSLKITIKHTVWGVLLILLIVGAVLITPVVGLLAAFGVLPAYLLAGLDFVGLGKPYPERVIVEIADHQFAIPQGYFGSGGLRREKIKGSRMQIRALLPDMKPYAEDTKQEFDKPGWGREISIGLGVRESRPSLAGVYERIKGQYSEPVSSEEMSRMGLALYRDPRRHWDELMVHLEEGKVTYMAFCKLLENMPSPSCDVYMDYTDDIYIDYSFARDHLEHWREIDGGLRELLRHFEQAAKTSINNQ